MTYSTRVLVFALALIPFSGCFAPSQDFDRTGPLWKQANPALPNFEKVRANQSNHKVLVGVLDSGIDYTISALAPNIHLLPQSNSPDAPFGFGVDLLGNDLFPFYRIFDPANGKDITDVYMSLEHGTHVAGLVGLGNPAIGIIPVRVYPMVGDTDDHGACVESKSEACQIRGTGRQIDVIVDGIRHAVAHGARIINMSLGMPLDHLPIHVRATLVAKVREVLSEPMQTTWKDVLMIAAAGNESRVVDDVAYSIPATLEAPELISVGALKDNGTIAAYSNTGPFVDVYTRGSNVASWVPHKPTPKRELMDGTSMAAPLIAHLAAELVLIDPTLSPSEMRGIILNTAKIRSFPVEDEDSTPAPPSPDAGIAAPKEVRLLEVYVSAPYEAKEWARCLLKHPELRAVLGRAPFPHGATQRPARKNFQRPQDCKRI